MLVTSGYSWSRGEVRGRASTRKEVPPRSFGVAMKGHDGTSLNSVSNNELTTRFHHTRQKFCPSGSFLFAHPTHLLTPKRLDQSISPEEMTPGRQRV